jgi:hypothetical protein
MGVPEAIRKAVLWGDTSGVVILDDEDGRRTASPPRIAVSAVPYLGR